MTSYNNSEKLKIFTDLKPLDIVSFNQIYMPVLGLEVANVYLSIFSQKQIFFYLNIDSYNLGFFLKNLGLTLSEFKQKIKVLEKFELAQISIKYSEDQTPEYILRLFPPLDIVSALQNQKLKDHLLRKISPDKFDELSLLNEKEYLGFELDLNINDEVDQDSHDLSVDKNVYYNFYDGIFQKTQKEFQISDEIIEFIKIYHINENKLSMEQLHNIGHKSIKNGPDGLCLCPDLFSHLIDIENNKPLTNVSIDEYDNFWSSLFELESYEIKKQFEKLFGKHTTIDFYLFITSKVKAPSALEKWVNDCVKNKDFKFPILNGILSFVKVWLNKIPIKYLIKMTDSFCDDGISTVEDFIEHIKTVINHDSKTKNRLNISMKSSNSVNRASFETHFLD